MEYYNQLTVDEAIELSQMSKQKFYDTYLHTNVLEVHKDDGETYLKLDEFISHFPDVFENSEDSAHANKTLSFLKVIAEDIESMKQQLGMLQKTQENQQKKFEKIGLDQDKKADKLENKNSLESENNSIKLNKIIDKNKAILTKHQQNNETLVDTLMRIKPELKKLL
ncbi:MAG: hypothetical protein HQL46_09340 [Gammaproteobacteria bacterium]|nr:hypothetical protein [Gammaproteobacteria bacterium]